MANGALTNDDRAARAADVAEYYSSKPGMDPVADVGLNTTLQDLLADMMHLAANEGVDWDSVQTMAEVHFNEERDEEREERFSRRGRKDWDPRG
jgi:hypothetical protein